MGCSPLLHRRYCCPYRIAAAECSIPGWFIRQFCWLVAPFLCLARCSGSIFKKTVFPARKQHITFLHLSVSFCWVFESFHLLFKHLPVHIIKVFGVIFGRDLLNGWIGLARWSSREMSGVVAMPSIGGGRALGDSWSAGVTIGETPTGRQARRRQAALLSSRARMARVAVISSRERSMVVGGVLMMLSFRSSSAVGVHLALFYSSEEEEEEAGENDHGSCSTLPGIFFSSCRSSVIEYIWHGWHGWPGPRMILSMNGTG